MRTKLLEKHRTECFAIGNVEDGTWPTPWAYLDHTEQRISNGNWASPRQLGDRWWYARCNDPSCPAAIVVNETDLLAAFRDTEAGPQ